MKRELWLDYARSFACILVAIGHLLMSFQDAALLSRDGITSFFIEFIYHFHVYIFFFCGGYLFQKKFAGYLNWKERTTNKLIRCFDYLIIYIVFSAITYIIKVLFSGDVNTAVNTSFLQTIVQSPINQMWYMYAIFMITLVTPAMISHFSYYIVLSLAIIAKILMCLPSVANHISHPIDYLLNNEIWFVLGCIWAYKNVLLDKKIISCFILFFIFGALLVYLYKIENSFLNTLLTLSGILGSTELIRNWAKKRTSLNSTSRIFSKYTLQIYLLHTICAAGIRIILLKLNIQNFTIHLFSGLFFSFIIPILCAYIAERTKLLNIFFFPSKTILQLRKSK